MADAPARTLAGLGPTVRPFSVAALIGAAWLLTGCASGNWFSDATELPAPDQRALTNGPLDLAGLTVYLEMMRELVEGDPITQSLTFRRVAEAADDAPTTTNRLKLALALATPGHPGADAADAQSRLSGLLAAGAALLPEERMLVAIHLEEVEQRLALDAAAEQLRQEATAAIERDSETAAQLEAATAENARLRQELEEAQQKLNAITNIERSIRERENDAVAQ